LAPTRPVGGLRIGGFSFALLDLGASMALEATVRADSFLYVVSARIGLG